jgi:hypothetical protein
MKKIFLVALLVAAGGIATSEAQTRASFRAQTGARSENLERGRTPEPTRRGEIGAIPRAVRGGNPVQMLNPQAPRRYFGAPQDTVTAEPYFNRERYTGHHITGIILIGVVW